MRTNYLDTKCRDQILFVVTTSHTFFKKLVDYFLFVFLRGSREVLGGEWCVSMVLVRTCLREPKKYLKINLECIS